MTAARVRLAAARAALAVAAALFPLAAQVVVEDDEAVVTGVVELLDVNVAGGRSVGAAMAMSLALPGAGHHYIDKRKSAYVYLSIDAASVFGAILFNALANQREGEARSFAQMAAGIGRVPSGEAYWRRVGAHMDAADYNEKVELSRGDDLYTDPETWWRWGDESQKDEYNDIRQEARDLRVATSFFIGAMVLNRIISIVDLRVFKKKSLSSGIRFQPALSPDLNGGGMSLQADF